MHLPRAARRTLRSTGAVAGNVPHLRTQAGEAALKLWQSCEDRQVVVWLNNWYRKRFGSDPVSNDMSLNLSVLALLHTTKLPNFPGHLSLSDVMVNATLVVRRLMNTFERIRDGVRAVNESDMQPQNIRVPLDVQRKGIRSLQWLPYLLTEETVSSQRDLVGILADLDSLRIHTRHVLPLLVDMDIHYRVMKVMYGQSTMRWNYAEHLSMTPVLYGVCNSIHSLMTF